MSSEIGTGPFDRDLLQQVAEEHGIDVDSLVTLLDDHQRQMASLPGVENLVYEWRKQFDTVVLHQTPDAYYVAAPEWAWEEFRDHLAADEEEMAALRDLHHRVVSASEYVPTDTAETTAPMILLRE